jgi:hypothetical protein
MGFGYYNKIILSEKDIFYKELKVKHLKTLYKCLLGDDLYPEIIFLNLKKILQDITSLNKKEIDNLSFLDFFLLLLEIRFTSIGNYIYIQPQEKQNTRVEINLHKFANILQNFKNTQLLEPDTINNIQIFYTLPTFKNILEITDLTFEYVYLFFIKEIKINQTNFNMQTLNVQDKKLIFEQLPVKATSIIFKKINTFLDEINKINLLANIFGVENAVLSFNLNSKNLAGLVKMLFGEQLMLLYENIFILSKLGNLTPTYIENCTPGEYILFVKKLDAVLNLTESNTEETS